MVGNIEKQSFFISIADYNMAISIANSEGLKGRKVAVEYIPSSDVTEVHGKFIVHEYGIKD